MQNNFRVLRREGKRKLEKGRVCQLVVCCAVIALGVYLLQDGALGGSWGEAFFGVILIGISISSMLKEHLLNPKCHDD
jgi:Kef-type K+ transport system membrane component KefB